MVQAYNIKRASSIDGWMSEPELLFLAELASQSEMICEAGSYKGRSTRAFADNTQGLVYAVDPWDGAYQVYGKRDYGDSAYQSYHQNGDNEIYSQFYVNLYDHLRNRRVRIQRTNFTDFKPKDKFDLIFLDAIHEYEALKQDIAHARTIAANGAIIAGHDFIPAWPGVVQAVDEIFPDREVRESIWFIQL